MLKGEIKPKFFKVSYYEATNWGFEPVRIKYFTTLEYAKQYALKLAKVLKQMTEETDDYEFVEIRNEKDEVMKAWRIEERRVVHYPSGW